MEKLLACFALTVRSVVPIPASILSLAFTVLILGSSPSTAATSPAGVCRPATFSIPTADLVRTAAAIQHKQRLRILAIGSSSTQGIGATAPQFTYPAQLMADLNARTSVANVDVRNAGIGGETADQTLARLVNELDTYKPDLVLWQVGTNDAVSGGSDPAIFRRLVDAGVKSIQQRRIDAILIDPQFYLKIPDTDRYEHYVDLVRTTAEADNVAVFPRYRLMRAWNQEAGGVTPMLGPDGFHMGDRGYACLADLLADEITTSVARTNAKVALP